MGVTHAFIDEDESSGIKKIAGYITLRGSSLIMDSGEAVELNEEHVGFQYVILCADPEAVGFYKKIGFDSIRQLQEIPREHRNSTCIPMMMKIANA